MGRNALRCAFPRRRIPRTRTSSLAVPFAAAAVTATLAAAATVSLAPVAITVVASGCFVEEFVTVVFAFSTIFAFIVAVSLAVTATANAVAAVVTFPNVSAVDAVVVVAAAVVAPHVAFAFVDA
jgi:hypothetical protein